MAGKAGMSSVQRSTGRALRSRIGKLGQSSALLGFNFSKNGTSLGSNPPLSRSQCHTGTDAELRSPESGNRARSLSECVCGVWPL